MPYFNCIPTIIDNTPCNCYSTQTIDGDYEEVNPTFPDANIGAIHDVLYNDFHVLYQLDTSGNWVVVQVVANSYNAERPWVKEGDIIATSATSISKSDNIYREGDVRINGGTAIIESDGTGDQLYNSWLANATTSQHEFRFTGGEFPNPLPLSQPNNYVWGFGPNLANGGTLHDPTKAAFGLSFENEFYIGGEPVMEFHHLFIGTDLIQRRPFTSYFKKDGSYGAITNFISLYTIQDWDGDEVLEINTVSGTTNYNNLTTKFIHNFRGQNYQPIWQRDDGPNLVPLIGYLTGKLQLGVQSSDGVVQAFNGTRIGRVGGSDVVGSSIDNSVNLEIGYTGARFSSVQVNTGSANVLTLKSSVNTNPFTFQLPGNDAMYIYQNSIPLIGFQSTAIEAWKPVRYLTTFPIDGSGVPNGSTFKGVDGALYYKGDVGTVTLIASS